MSRTHNEAASCALTSHSLTCQIDACSLDLLYPEHELNNSWLIHGDLSYIQVFLIVQSQLFVCREIEGFRGNLKFNSSPAT